MATKKIMAQKFGAVNKAKLKLRFATKRTRTGAFKGRCRIKAHSHYK